MNTEFSSILNQDNRILQWATTMHYNKSNMTEEDKNISAVVDAWAKEIGRTGHDQNHELSALVNRALEKEAVVTNGELLERAFDLDAIGEFDDWRATYGKNGIQAFEARPGGNVNRTFVDFAALAPEYTNLQVETDISFTRLRRLGAGAVAELLVYINDALEAKKVSKVMEKIAAGLVNGDNVINETGALPTDTNMQKLELYLLDTAEDGDVPTAFALNKYIQAITRLEGVTTFLTDRVRDMYNTTGRVQYYGGVELLGYSGQRKMADGSFAVPDKTIIGFAGKVGSCITRGETRVFEESDINSEKVHLKVGGYQFGVAITNPEKVAKIVMGQ